MSATTQTQTLVLTGTASRAVRAGRAIHRGLVAGIEFVDAYAVLEIAALLATTVSSGILIAAGFGYSLFH